MKKQLLFVSLSVITVCVFGQDTIEQKSIGDIFLQGVKVNYLVAAFGWACIGVVISLLAHANTRDQSSPSTPVPFKPLFLLKDNWKRILLAFLLIIVSLIFIKDLFGKELTMFWALLIGLAWDQLAAWLKGKADILKVDR